MARRLHLRSEAGHSAERMIKYLNRISDMRKILPILLRGIILWLLLFIIIPSLKGNFVVTKWTICSAVICAVIILVVCLYIMIKR